MSLRERIQNLECPTIGRGRNNREIESRPRPTLSLKDRSAMQVTPTTASREDALDTPDSKQERNSKQTSV